MHLRKRDIGHCTTPQVECKYIFESGMHFSVVSGPNFDGCVMYRVTSPYIYSTSTMVHIKANQTRLFLEKLCNTDFATGYRFCYHK
jgi:hypothetical protein